MSTYINLIEWMDGFGSIDEIDTDKIYDNDFIIESNEIDNQKDYKIAKQYVEK